MEEIEKRMSLCLCKRFAESLFIAQTKILYAFLIKFVSCSVQFNLSQTIDLLYVSKKSQICLWFAAKFTH